MKISNAFPTSWAERQAERDRQAEEKATAPSVDSRTGEHVKHCIGTHHRWNHLRHPLVLICDLCDAKKMKDR